MAKKKITAQEHVKRSSQGSKKNRRVIGNALKAKGHPENEVKAVRLSEKSGAMKIKKKRKILLKNSDNKPVITKKKLDIPKEKLLKYSRGDGVTNKGVKSAIIKKKLQNREKAIEYSTEQAARLEFLLPEDSGYLEADEDEVTRQFTQKQIAAAVDITSATKQFEVDLQFGPYKMNYSRNGRHLLLGGQKGHVAALDWVTKKLMCEMNVMEEVVNVRWLHVETMFAVAQKEWVYVYDNQGIELHCLKQLNRVLQMEFLPYHFLLATSSEQGWLKWLDISLGKIVSQFNTRMGRLNLMVQNPYNAVLCLGHAQGTVSMWSPNMKEPLAKMLCHRSPLLGLAVDRRGQYMVTSAADKTVKTWDLRMLSGPLQEYHLYSHANNLALSDRGLLGLSMGNVVEVYKDPCRNRVEKAYLRHKSNHGVRSLQFSPYEDVLGVAHAGGFSSILVPGSGEPNFDAYEANPYQTKSQRQEREVKSLLEKIQPELITLDPSTVSQVDVPRLQDRVESMKKDLFLKPPSIDFEPRNRTRWRKGSAHKVKKIAREANVRNYVKTRKSEGNLPHQEGDASHGNNKAMGVLDRFKSKKN